MDKNDVIEYVMNTPGNTNRAVLSGMLDSIGQSSGVEPMIVNATLNEEVWTLDKTYGEIRTAYDSGTPIFIKKSEIYETSISVSTACVMNVYYQITTDSEDPEYDSALGSVETYISTYSVNTQESPHTLEALDVLYPYYN